VEIKAQLIIAHASTLFIKYDASIAFSTITLIIRRRSIDTHINIREHILKKSHPSIISERFKHNKFIPQSPRSKIMSFPLSFWDISLWLAVTAIILLITSELISPYYGKINLLINKKRLKNVALIMSTLFLITVAIRIYGIITST
jgi:hypothetical protein